MLNSEEMLFPFCHLPLSLELNPHESLKKIFRNQDFQPSLSAPRPFNAPENSQSSLSCTPQSLNAKPCKELCKNYFKSLHISIKTLKHSFLFKRCVYG